MRKNNYEREVKKELYKKFLTEPVRTQKLEEKLKKHTTALYGGYVMTVGQLCEFFKKK